MPRLFVPAPEPKTELGRYRVLSRTAGVRVSPLCLGGMSSGDAWSKVLGSMDKQSTFNLLHAFFDAGGNFIDTANNYQDEQSETWLGEWRQQRGNRAQIVLATKFASDYRSYAVGKGNGPNFAGNHKKSLHMSCRDSLRKLQTDYVEILCVRWWDPTTSVKELMDSLHVLLEQGKVLYLGASDAPAWVVSACNQYAVDSHKTPFLLYQGRLPGQREIIPMARAWGMALAPWDVLGGGMFQMKRALAERRARGEGLRLMFAPAGEGEARQSPEQETASEALEGVAAEHGVDSITAVALAYVMSKAENVFPIVGGRKVEHLMDNIKALSIKLTDEQIKYLESVKSFPSAFLGTDPDVTGYNYRLDGTAKMAFPHPRKVK